MFSYRHAFHAGNHADVLKHMVLVGVLRHLTAKPQPIQVVDTHAGAGLYRLDGDAATTSGESAEGVQRLLARLPAQPAPLLADYLAQIANLNPGIVRATAPEEGRDQGGGAVRVYPGSPFLAHALLRPQDRLRLFELHPTDHKALAANLAQLEAGRQIALRREDGFEALKALLPPPSRRGLVLCDPSYEIKTDYARVAAMVADALTRFATGTYLVWYPLIPRPEAHGLPRRLKTLANKAGKSWLHATLTVKSARTGAVAPGAAGRSRPGLTASGVFLVNPPFTLRPALAQALPQLVTALGHDRQAGFTLEHGG